MKGGDERGQRLYIQEKKKEPGKITKNKYQCARTHARSGTLGALKQVENRTIKFLNVSLVTTVQKVRTNNKRNDPCK